MRVKFRDVECYSAYEYEYYDNESNKQFSVWKPDTLADIDKEKEEQKRQEVKETENREVDYLTEQYIDELGLRSLKKQNLDSDVEQIDLAFLDDDSVEELNTNSGILATATKMETAISNITKEPDLIPLNENGTTSAEEGVYKTNLINNLLNQSKCENATWCGNSSASPEDKNILVNSIDTERLRQIVEEYDTSGLQKDDNMTTDQRIHLPLQNTSNLKTANATLNNSAVPLMPWASDVNMTLATNVSDVFKDEGINSTYDGIHQTVPVEIPDKILKYLGKGAPHPKAQTTLSPTKKPKTKKVILRQHPQKGQGMKTKRRMEYKPQPRSGLPLSPRGFNTGMSPRGFHPSGPQLQPVSSKEDLINVPVVIGVPRPDFSDYELYVHGEYGDDLGDMQDDVKQEEYEYVSYKDPYGSTEDLQSFTLDEVTKYHLKNVGQNVRTYFISAEEVEWDYAGYGKR